MIYRKTARALIAGATLACATLAAAAQAETIMVNTEANGWLAVAAPPSTGWESSLDYDDSGWAAAQVIPHPAGPHIWIDTASPQSYFRYAFDLGAPVQSASMWGGFDDDGSIWINGTLVYADTNGYASELSAVITPYLVQGRNLIAAHGIDYGGNKLFRAYLTIDVADPGETAQNPLLPSAPQTPDGAWEFAVTPPANTTVFFDPDYATGYDFAITSGTNSFASVLLPVLAGDDGLYTLGYNGITTDVVAGSVFAFDDTVTAFSVTGIDLAAMVDPANPAGFVTGIAFNTDAPVTLTQTPTGIVTSPAPEPSAWAMMVGGFGLIGGSIRRRRAAIA